MRPAQDGRRERSRLPREGRHRGAAPEDRFSKGFAALAGVAYGGASVSANVVDTGTGATLVAIDEKIVLPTASVGKVLLLIEVAARISADEASGLQLLDRSQLDAIGGSGVWQQLQVPSLPMTDLAALVGSASDNLATNVLLGRIGLDAVRARAESLGLKRTALLDLVRDERGPDDAPQVSVGSAAELTWLLVALSRGQVVDRSASRRVLGWLANNADLSLVASAFGLDPLEHREPDHGLRVVNKTGADAGVRSEIGLLTGPRAEVAYALTIRFADASIAARLSVLDAMRTFGTDLLEYVS